MEFETQIECQRQKLAQEQEFSIRDFFLFLDTSRNGMVSFKIFCQFINILGVDVTNPQELRLLFDAINPSKDGFISFEDLCRQILPINRHLSQMMLARTGRFVPKQNRTLRNTDLDKQLNQITLTILRTIIPMLIDRVKKEQDLRQELGLNQREIYHFFSQVKSNSCAVEYIDQYSVRKLC